MASQTPQESLQEYCARLGIVPFTPDECRRIVIEQRHLVEDYDRLKREEGSETAVKARYLSSHRNRGTPYSLTGKSVTLRCRDALKHFGPNYLREAMFSQDMDNYDKERVERTSLLLQVKPSYMLSQECQAQKRLHSMTSIDDLDLTGSFSIMDLPVELAEKIIEKVDYSDVHNLAAANNAMHSMLKRLTYSIQLPPTYLTITLDERGIETEWSFVDDEKKISPKMLNECATDVRRKQQFMNAATDLFVSILSGAVIEDCAVKAVQDYIMHHKFSSVVLSCDNFTDNYQKVLQIFDPKTVSLFPSRLSGGVRPLPTVKDVRCLFPIQQQDAEVLLASTSILNFDLSLNEVDTLMQLLQQWDRGEREIENLNVRRPFSNLFHPFGRRYRNAGVARPGYLDFVCTKTDFDDYREFVEYHFVPTP